MAELPGTKIQVEDGGLNVSPEPQILNDSILVIGTASDGPMYEPIPIIADKNLTQTIFGAFGQGTLVRGVFEVIDATIEGTPDVRAMRIGNGKKAKIEISERISSSATADQTTSSWNSLKLEALFPGSKYNGVSLFLDEEKKINIYNPRTGIWSKFTYDDTNPNNNAVDARNVQELVDAINADSNISSIAVASTSGIQAQYEIQVGATSSGVSVVNGKAILDLNTMLASYTSTSNPTTDVLATGYIWEATTAATAGNLIQTLEEVFSLSTSTPTLLETKGLTTVKVGLSPFDGKGDSRFDTIHALEDYNSDNLTFHSPAGSTASGNVISEYMSYLNKETFANVTLAATGLPQFSATLSAPGWFLTPDDSQEPTVVASGTAVNGLGPAQTVTDSDGNTGTSTLAHNGCIALAAARASSGVYKADNYLLDGDGVAAVTATAASYARITASGIDDYITDPGKVDIQVSETGGTSDAEWQSLYYHAASGIYVSGFVVADGTGTATVCVGANATGYLGTNSLVTAGLITSSGTVNADRYLRMTCNTVKGFLSEVESLPALQAANSNWLSYFFRGQDLLFSETVPWDTIVNYGVKVNYEPGSDVQVTDASNGELKIVSDTQPGPAGAALSTTQESIIGLKYKYLPQFPAITTAAVSCEGGTDGTDINNASLYDEYAKAYEYLENYAVQIYVPMGASLDATKGAYNSITGLPETVNAEFQVQLDDFLSSNSEDNEAIATLGVEQAPDSTLAAVKTWVKRLTEQDLTDHTRGANIMPLLDSKYISVCAFEPVFTNIGGLPYSSNGMASYAGMISSLEPHHSPTNKSIPNAQRVRFDLSNSQLSSLSDSRIVSMRKKANRHPVITEAITAAATGSDFTKLTTMRITNAAAEVVRSVCDPYIGQPNTQGKRNAMEASITKGLNNMVEAGALRKYTFSVSSTPNQQVLGTVEIDLILVPIFEIKKIRTRIRLRTDVPSAT